jgi:hypothetical protein
VELKLEVIKRLITGPRAVQSINALLRTTIARC